MKLGDAISTVATPIARALNLPCIDPETNQLRPESRCNKARIAMNEGRLADAFYDRFWPETKNKNRKEPTTMQFVITKQIAVEAETAEEAMSKVNEGKTISMSVSQRPQPQAQPQIPVRPNIPAH